MVKKTLTFTTLIFLFLGCKVADKILHNTLHPQVHHYKNSNKALQTCHFEKAIEIVNNNQNSLLKNSELGLGYFFKQNYLKSNNYFNQAINLYRMNENKPIFDISTFLKKEYQGEGYDKVLLHNYKAINYLLQGDAEGARVEAKNSNLIQQEEREKLNKFKKENIKNNPNSYLLSGYSKLFNNVDSKHNPYQNPFAYYISALSYAEDEDYDNALVDIRQALKFIPDTDILRHKLKMYQKNKSQKSIEIFFDIGQSPLKSQVKLKIDMGNGEKRMAYLPSFSLSLSNIDHIKIVNSKGEEIAKSSLLADINAIKINEFKEKLPSILYLISQQASISLTTNTLDKKSQLIATLFKAGSAIYGQQNIGTWSFLPQKILVASFLPKEKEKYTMLVVTKEGDILQRKLLNIERHNKTKNIYQHFTIRGTQICY